MKSKFINREELQRIAGALSGDEWLPLRVSLETGLRIGDVLKAKTTDIVKTDGEFSLKYTAEKTGKKGRAPLPAPLAKRLLSGKKRGAFLFPSYGKTGHLTRQAAWQRMKRGAELAGLPVEGLSPHSLRKVYAVHLRHEKGFEAVREALQHSADAVTRLYAYSDTVTGYAPDEPIRWQDIDILADYLLQRMRENSNSNTCSGSSSCQG